MMVDGVDDVGRRQLLAVVKLHALADLEHPLDRAGLGFPAFGQPGRRLGAFVELHPVVAPAIADGLHIGGVISSGSAPVGRFLSEGRRVGAAGVSTYTSRWLPAL